MPGRQPQSSTTPKELLARKTCPPVILITCPQLMRANRLIDKIVETFSKNPADHQITRRRGGELTAEKVAPLRDDIMTLSLFVAPRFFIIENADDIPDNAVKKLAPFLSDLPAQTYIIFVAKSLPVANPITQYCKQAGTFIVLEKLEGAELAKWTAHEISAVGIKKFSSDLPQLIIEHALGDPEEIVRITKQLALFIDSDCADTKDFRTLFPLAADPSEFELVDACSDNNPAKAELLFHQLVERGKSPFMLLAIISRVFSNFRAIRYLQSKGHSDAHVRQVMNMTPWIFNKNLSSAKRYKINKLEHHAQAIIKADSKLKNRSLGPETIFSELFAGLKP